MKRIPVLLVEDNPGDAVLIREMLCEHDEPSFELTHVDRLSAAMEALADGDFRVVLLDLSLPDSRGLETFQALRKAEPRLPVVMLTGLDDDRLAVQALHEGGQDYLIKGQISTRQLEHSLHFALGRHQRQNSIEEFLRATETELALARQIHADLLPREHPVRTGLDIHGHSISAAAIGGDAFQYLDLPEGNLGIAVADATGHGLGPSLLMVAVRSYLRAFAQTHVSPGQILTLANRLFVDDVADGNNCTILLAKWNAATRALEYASAGHPPGLLIRADGSLKARLYSTGLPLGILPDASFPTEAPATLDSGDVLLLHTDGLNETRSPAGEWFGSEHALKILSAHRDRPASQIVDALFDGVREFACGKPQRDDTTIVVMKATA